MRGSDASELSGEIALWAGLILALASMTTAMAQVERGVNRVYGIRRDRPARVEVRPRRSLTAVLAVPVGVGFLLLVAGARSAWHYWWAEDAAQRRRRHRCALDG